MKKLIYIALISILSLSCEIDNTGPILEDLDIIFFLEEGLEVAENNTEDIIIEIGSTRGDNSAQLTLSGTATEGVDYLVTGDLSISFADNVYSTSITISLIDNLNPDDDHTIIVSLPEGRGYSENNRREFILNIINNEVSLGTVVSAISASNDDVEESETNGNMVLDSSDLELGEFDTFDPSGTPQGVQTIGLRFNDIAIPANAMIISASIQFTADNTGSDPVELTIYAENVGNAPEFTFTDFNLTTRDKTTSNAVWSVPEWLTVGENGPAQRTVDLSVIVQEIVNRTDWSSDNSIIFIMEHTGVSIGVMSNSGGREAATFEGEPGEEPVLTIDWEI